jgi:hypothetical protein
LVALGLFLPLVLSAALLHLLLYIDLGARLGHQRLDVFAEKAPERAEKEQ